MKSILLSLLLTSITPLLYAMKSADLLVTKAAREGKQGFISTPEQRAVVNQRIFSALPADCGYHALFNGLTIAEYIRTIPRERRARLLLWLTDFAVKKKEFFASAQGNPEDSNICKLPKSFWKQAIVELRARNRAKDDIFNLLLRSIKGAEQLSLPDNNSDSRKMLENVYKCMNQKDTWIQCLRADAEDKAQVDKLPAIIQEAAKALTECSKQSDECAQSYVLSTALIRDALERALIEKSNKALIGGEDEVIQTYESMQSKGIDYFFDLKKDVVKVQVPYGEGSWLNESEISLLLNENNAYTRSTFISEPAISPSNINFFVIGDSGEPIKEVFGRESFRQLKDIMLEEEKNHVAVILIYEPGSGSFVSVPASSWSDNFPWPFRSIASYFLNSQSLPSQNSLVAKLNNGHWYTLVPNKVGKCCEFIVMDSLSRDDKNRVNDPRVKEIIQELGEVTGLDPTVDLQEGGIGLAHGNQLAGEQGVEKKGTPGSILPQSVQEENSRESNPISFKVVDISAKQLPEGTSASEIGKKTKDDTYFYNTIVFKIIVVAAVIVILALIVKKKWYDTRSDKKVAHDGKNAPAIASTAADPKKSN